MEKPMYRMSIVGHEIINPRWRRLEDPESGKMFDESEEWKLAKAFALQQDSNCDPDDEWYVKVNFIEYDTPLPAPFSEYKVHIFPEYVPLRSIMGKHQDQLLDFMVDDDIDHNVLVICDQRSEPGYTPGKWEDPDDEVWSQDPFVSELMNAMYRRIYEPYNIDYKKEYNHREETQMAMHKHLCELFNVKPTEGV